MDSIKNEINKKRREQYALKSQVAYNEHRRMKYRLDENRGSVLQKARADRCGCTVCGREYRRRYIAHHMIKHTKINKNYYTQKQKLTHTQNKIYF